MAVYIILGRPWRLRWGATDREYGERLPGDDLIAHPTSATRAITSLLAPRQARYGLGFVQLGQGRRLLDAVAAQRAELVGFFACLYYAYLRPAEAAALTIDSCTLPKSGWGRLTLTGSAKRVPAAWTDDGSGLDQRQLKHRARDTIRVVPVPPVLVTTLSEHIKRFGTPATAGCSRSPVASAAPAAASPRRSTATSGRRPARPP